MSGQRRIYANIPRLNALLDEAQLDAVVLRSGQNFAYLSGVVYPGTLARHQDLADSMRGVMVLWPRTGKPVVVTNKTAADLVQRDSWVEAIELYEAYVESPYAKLANVIKAAGLGTGRVGFEKDYVSARDWALVEGLLPHMKMANCTDVMNRVRWVKTPDEVEMIRRAADLLDDVYHEVFERIRPGDTERKLHSDIIGTSLAKGFEWAHGILISDKNAVRYGGESDVVLNTGDVIKTDYVCYLNSYPGHQSRAVVLGEPNARQREEYQIYRDIYRAAIDRCRPGAKANDLYGAVMNDFAKHHWEFKSSLIGHGVGPWWHQQEPILRRGSDAVLEEGMVLALEPGKSPWKLQDMILVKEGSPELLSAKFNTDELYVAAH